jgi:glycosyltransferase involved in cell wall biosynthesis
LRIIHVLRTPVGGLFRHVCDLVKGQSALGHDVGIFCDSSTGGAGAEAALAKISQFCKLGIQRVPISTMPNLADIKNAKAFNAFARQAKADIVHGHGAKGGLYARLASFATKTPSVYTPHGGSLHYEWAAIPGFLFMATEWALRQKTAGLAFVCEYEKNLFAKKIGIGSAKTNVVHNGLWKDEFNPVHLNADACDLFFVGELCHRKGVDILIDAVAILKPERKITVAMIGDGPDMDEYKAQVARLNLQDQIRFCGRLPMAKALTMGKIFILPSRAEAFPYVIVEALAAHKVCLSTDIAGLGEVLPPALLYPTENVDALVNKLRSYFANPKEIDKISEALAKVAPQNFSAEKMVKSISDFYQTLL